MARPKKLNADYFSHDADMRNDPKLKALRRKFGIQGYAVWNMLLEILTDSDHFEYEWTELNIELLAGDFDIEPEFLKEVVDYCILLKLLSKDEDILFSEKLKERFETMLNRRNVDRKRKSEEYSAKKTKESNIIGSEKPQSKVKESKGKESKVNTSSNDEGVYYNIAVLKNSYLKNQKLCSSVIENQRLKSAHQLSELLNDFNKHLDQLGTGSKTWQDYTSHFLNWMKKRIANPTQNQPATAPERF